MADRVSVDDSQKLISIDIPYNCPMKWRDMEGDERTRYCGKCEQNVYNVSRMTRDEAVSFINEKEGQVCVRFYQRTDGTVVTRDCLSIIGTEKLRRKFPVLAWLNFYFAVMALILLPMLGPAVVTIINGGMGPIRRQPTDEELHTQAELERAEKKRLESESELINQIMPE